MENCCWAACLPHEFLPSSRLSFKNEKKHDLWSRHPLHGPSWTHEENIQILKAKPADHPQVNSLGIAFGLRSPQQKYKVYQSFKDSKKNHSIFPETSKTQNPPTSRKAPENLSGFCFWMSQFDQTKSPSQQNPARAFTSCHCMPGGRPVTRNLDLALSFARRRKWDCWLSHPKIMADTYGWCPPSLAKFVYD